MASVEVGSADPAAQYLEQNLTVAWPDGGQVGHVEPRLLADDSLHAQVNPRMQRAWPNCSYPLWWC